MYSGYLWWVAVTALVIAVAALAVSLAEMRRRQRHDKAARTLFAANQAFGPRPADAALASFQEKWEREIKSYEDQIRAKQCP